MILEDPGLNILENKTIFDAEDHLLGSPSKYSSVEWI